MRACKLHDNLRDQSAARPVARRDEAVLEVALEQHVPSARALGQATAPLIAVLEEQDLVVFCGCAGGNEVPDAESLEEVRVAGVVFVQLVDAG